MNYVIFFPDELRAEELHCYGNKNIKTPNFDRMAEEGVLFEQCHVQNTVCSPSRCSMITGRYIHNDGHRTLRNLVKPYEKNLFRYMKEYGYEVMIYGKNDMFSPESKKLYADQFHKNGGVNHNISKPEKEFGEQGYYNFLYDSLEGDPKDHEDYKNVESGINYIKGRKKGDKPFILFLPLLLPHCPYTAHEPFYSMYTPNDIMPLRGYGTGKPMFHKLIRQLRNIDGMNLEKVQSVYMGMTSYTDWLLGMVMDALENSEVGEDTMLIASADHGDYAGDYGLVEKWNNGMEDVLTRVPLIIKAPFAKKRHRVKEQVELFDIMATILDCENIEAQHTHFAHSLMDQLKGEAGDPERAVFCEGGFNLNEPHCLETRNKYSDPLRDLYYPKVHQQHKYPKSVGRTTMMRTLTHKLIKRSYGDSELYDLVKDPLELTNVLGKEEYKEIQLSMEQKMLEWYINTSDTVPFEKDPR